MLVIGADLIAIPLLAAGLVAWAVAPLALAARRFARSDL